MERISTMPVEEHDDSYLRVPPSSVQAEMAVLGGLLLDNRAWDRIFDLLAEGDFYKTDHRTIWREIGRLIERNKQADVVTVAEAVGPELAGYVGRILESTPSAHNIRAHAQIVRDRSILRSLIAAAGEISDRAWEHGVDPQEALEQAEARVLGIADNSAQDQDREPVPLKDAVFEAVDWLDAERSDGIPTGYPRIDAQLSGGGMQPEQLIVIAGRPSMGKSALSYAIAESAASAGKTVAYFALETSRREIGVRALRWHMGSIGRSEAIRILSALPIIIDDTPAITLAHMRVRLRRIRRQRGLHLVVVDYLQLMRQRAESRLQEVSEVSRGLKAVSKEFGVPVIAVAQLNRGVESRPDKRPLLSDLRESGQLEQDADVVLMCHRDEYHDPDTHLKGFGEIFIRKNKDGPVGEALLRWDGPRTRWIHYEGERPSPPKSGSGVDSNVKPFRPKGEES